MLAALRNLLARAACALHGHGPFVRAINGKQRGRRCYACGAFRNGWRAFR